MSVLRSLGTIPISVGTALAVEALQNTPMHRYQTFLINLRTIVRNARSAYEEVPKESELIQAVKEDILGIMEFIVGLKLKTILDIKLYYPSYNSLARQFPLASLKEMDPKKLISPKDEKRKKQIQLEQKVIDETLKEFDKFIISTDCSVPQFGGEALIITHHPVDLVTTEGYTRLHLLESYTGAIKGYASFYTKLTGGKDMPNMPFNKLTIQIFGDNAVNFYSQSSAVKNEVKKLAMSVPWSSASTVNFVASSIRRLPGTLPEKSILLKMI